MKKRIILICSIFCTALISILCVVGYSSGKVDFFDLGKAINEENVRNDKSVAFEINGYPFTLKQYNTYKAGMRIGEKTLTEQEIFDKYVNQKLLLQKAVEMGCVVTEEEIEVFTTERLQLIEDNVDMKKQLEDYLAGADISYEEYVEISKEASRQQLLYEKMLDIMKKNEISDVKRITTNTDAMGYQEYMKNVTKELREKAEIKIINSELKKSLSEEAKQK